MGNSPPSPKFATLLKVELRAVKVEKLHQQQAGGQLEVGLAQHRQIAARSTIQYRLGLYRHGSPYVLMFCHKIGIGSKQVGVS